MRAAEAASVEAQEGTIRVKDVQRAIVVGAGPAGSATAMLLAKEGYDVQVKVSPASEILLRLLEI